MKIVVLGATGNVGARFVEQAVAADHQIVAYARNPHAVTARPGVDVLPGTAEDTVALTAALTGSDALVISITGPMKDTTFMQRTLPNVIDAAHRAGVGRVVLVSAFGAGDTSNKASGFARVLYRTVLGKFFADKAAGDALLRSSGLDWTIVYPVNLKAGPPLRDAAVQPLEQVSKVPGLPTLPFDDVAEALVRIVGDPSTIGRRLLITTPNGWKPAQ
ncbi:NAD(P)H-binding protein [Humibacter antri]